MGRDDGAPVGASGLHVTVAFSESPGEAVEIAVRVADGSSTLDVIRASGVLERFPTIDISTAVVGVWGRLTTLQARMGQGDRVEIYRPLKIDPKEARRKRASQLKAASREGVRRKGAGAVG
ncbi:MAG: RnfH family protein [Caldimonas sp.]